MNIEYVKTGSVKPYEKNPRRNDDSVEFVSNSIKEFGFQQPIVVDKDMVVIAGHTRLKAAKKLKLKEVPVIVADNLTDEQAKAYRLADNKVSESSEWDFELLDDELNQILNIDMDEFGFDFTEDEEDEEPEEKHSAKIEKKPYYLAEQIIPYLHEIFIELCAKRSLQCQNVLS